jgi:hypothetical protein
MEVESSRAKALPKSLIIRYRIARTRVPETCSADRWCTQMLRMERLWRQHSSEKRQKPYMHFGVGRYAVYIGLSDPISCHDHNLNRLRLLFANFNFM